MTFNEVFKTTIDYNAATLSIEVDASVAIVFDSAYFKITGVDDTVLYENDNYSTGTGGTPDLPGTFSIDIPVDGEGAPLNGDYTIYSKTSVGTFDGSLDKTFSYCMDAPDAEIEPSYDCLSATFTSKDTTDYTLTCLDDDVEPSSMLRTHEVDTPDNVKPGVTPPDDVSENSETITIGSLWTGWYNISLSTTLTYEFPCGLFVDIVIGAQDAIEVECNDCTCDFNECFNSLLQQYVYSRQHGSSRDQQKLSNLLLELVATYQVYNNARRCGGETDGYCERISNLLDFAGVNCCSSDTDEYSTQVLGGSGSTSVDGDSFYFGSGAPSDGDYNEGDVYFDTDAPNNVYQYSVSGGWTLQMSIQGDAESDGSSSGVVITSGILNQVYTKGSGFKTIDIPYDGTNELTSRGDKIKLQARFSTKGTLGYGSYIIFSDTDGLADDIYIDAEGYDEGRTHIIVEQEFTLLEDYDEGGTDTSITTNIKYSGLYNDVQVYSDQKENIGDNHSWGIGFQVFDNGKMYFDDYNMTFFKAV